MATTCTVRKSKRIAMRKETNDYQSHNIAHQVLKANDMRNSLVKVEPDSMEDAWEVNDDLNRFDSLSNSKKTGFDTEDKHVVDTIISDSVLKENVTVSYVKLENRVASINDKENGSVCHPVEPNGGDVKCDDQLVKLHCKNNSPEKPRACPPENERLRYACNSAAPVKDCQSYVQPDYQFFEAKKQDFAKLQFERPSKTDARQTCVESKNKELPSRTKDEKKNAYNQAHQSKHGRRKKRSGVDTLFHCGHCDFVTKTKTRLMYHVQRQHGERSLKCTFCESTFAVQTDLRKHLKRHTDRHLCEVCGKVYKDKRSMRKHSETHKANSYSQCPICKKCLGSENSSKLHMRRLPEGSKKMYQCCKCEKTFMSRNLLRDHVNTHTGAKPYICDICQKGFAIRRNLTIHKDTHSTDPQFACHICGKMFKQRASLVIHLKSHVDVTERIHICKVCQKRFTQASALKRHERIHSGEKPYHCTECPKQFNDLSILRRHKDMHRRNKLNRQKTFEHSEPTSKNTEGDANPQSSSTTVKSYEVSRKSDGNITATETAEAKQKGEEQTVVVPPGSEETVLFYHDPEVNSQTKIIVYVEEGIKMDEQQLVEGALIASGITI